MYCTGKKRLWQEGKRKGTHFQILICTLRIHTAGRLQILGNYLTNRLQDGYETDYLATYVTRRIMETHGMIKLSDLADETGYTDRYLRRSWAKSWACG